MLFDLQNPRRRRFIKVAYSILAILFVVGFVGFGIGSETGGGGLADIFGTGGSGDSVVEDDIEDAEKQLEENPRSQPTLVQLVTLNFQQANNQLEVDENGFPVVTSEAQESYNQAADYWHQYLELKPKRANSAAATQMVQVFFALAQNASSGVEAQANLESAAEAQQVAADQSPSVGNLKNLAFYLYLSGEFAAADRVAEQAIAKAPAGERDQTRQELRSAEQQGRAFQKQLAAERKAGSQGGGNPLEAGPGALSGQ